MQTMQTVAGVEELRAIRRAWRAAGETVALVPTMGALHAGHLSLVDAARARAARVVASVFVNPAQFGPQEDLATYPRDPVRDAELLDAAGCDLLFLPSADTIYPPAFTTWVVPEGAARGLEGDFRPHFFRGVATVVVKLFHLVEPDLAIFGRKDAQQLAVVRQLVRDLDIPVEIVPGETVRENDGLAMSSRNAYLSGPERRAAAVLYRALEAARETVAAGERNAVVIADLVRGVVAEEPLAETDYVEVADPETFQSVTTIDRPVVVPIAVRIGGTRLIDSITIAPESR